jgi:hypothetical protein
MKEMIRTKLIDTKEKHEAEEGTEKTRDNRGREKKRNHDWISADHQSPLENPRVRDP